MIYLALATRAYNSKSITPFLTFERFNISWYLFIFYCSIPTDTIFLSLFFARSDQTLPTNWFWWWTIFSASSCGLDDAQGFFALFFFPSLSHFTQFSKNIDDAALLLETLNWKMQFQLCICGNFTKHVLLELEMNLFTNIQKKTKIFFSMSSLIRHYMNNFNNWF